LTSGDTSAFGSEAEMRAAWEERRDEIMAEWLNRTPPRSPGSRPAAWWHFESGRPQRIELWSEARGRWSAGSLDERADAYDEYEMEPLVFLASIGELRAAELEVLRQEAAEASLRVDTAGERIGSGGLDRADRRRVKLWEAVEAADVEAEAALAARRGC
jgi:hypothetical protein